MKEYKVRVYNFIERIHDEYTVFAINEKQAREKTNERIFIETDWDYDEYEILEVEKI